MKQATNQKTQNKRISGPFYNGWDLRNYRPEIILSYWDIRWIIEIYYTANESKFEDEAHVADVEDQIKQIVDDLKIINFSMPRLYMKKVGLLIELSMKEELHLSNGLISLLDACEKVRSVAPWLDHPEKIIQMMVDSELQNQYEQEDQEDYNIHCEQDEGAFVDVPF